MRKFLQITILTSFLLSFGCLSAALAGSAPRVVVSIKPLHALVAGVMEGVAEPQLLIKTGGSPHGYALRPSESRALADADLVVWIGPSLESFLEKPLTSLASRATRLTLAEALRDQLLPVRHGGSWGDHDHDAADHRPLEHSAGGNPHLWLCPLLAQQIVARSAAALSEIDPPNASRYQQNAQQLQQRLADLHQQLTSKLAPVKHVPYLVFHDAYQYFEAAYGLNAIGSLGRSTRSANRGPDGSISCGTNSMRSGRAVGSASRSSNRAWWRQLSRAPRPAPGSSIPSAPS